MQKNARPPFRRIRALLAGLILAGSALPAADEPAANPNAAMEAETARLKAEKALIEARTERDKALANRLAGGTERPAAPTGAYTQKDTTDKPSPLALAVAHEALTDLGKTVRDELKTKLAGKKNLVFMDQADSPPTFWRWIALRHNLVQILVLVLEAEDATKKLPGWAPVKKSEIRTNSIAGAVEIAAALPAAFQTVAALWRKDVTETTGALTLDVEVLRAAVLQDPDKDCWAVYHSLGALANRELKTLDGLVAYQELLGIEKLSARLDLMRTFTDAVLADDAKNADALRAKKLIEQAEAAIAELKKILATEDADGETGLTRILREELIARALFGDALFAAANTQSLDDLATASPVRFVQLTFTQQAHSRVETKSFWRTRYHYEATLVAHYAIFTPSGRRAESGVVVRSYLRKAPPAEKIGEITGANLR